MSDLFPYLLPYIYIYICIYITLKKSFENFGLVEGEERSEKEEKDFFLEKGGAHYQNATSVSPDA